MKAKLMFFIILFWVLYLNPLSAQITGLKWNTFMGSGSGDYCLDIALGSAGKIYVIGYSDVTWGTPVNTHSGGTDIHVACLDSSGNLIWNTFLGSASNDYGNGIALDSLGNVYATGMCYGSWGTPLNPYSGAWDAFVAKLDGNGNLLWNTFGSSASNEVGQSIAIDGSGNIYVTGYSDATWGSPVNPYSGDNDVFIVSLNSSGGQIWNTFLGSSSADSGSKITLDGSGNVYVAGSSDATWGSPVNAHSGALDVFTVCLNGSGILIWNTFLGSALTERSSDIILDGSGNIYVTGYSEATWGSPVNAYSGGEDGFTARLDSFGNLVWNTFMGSASDDRAYGITVNGSGNLCLTGYSQMTWGSPVNTHSGDDDSFTAGLDSAGNLLWNTFLGSPNNDRSYKIALDASDNIHITGYSEGTWGSPVNAYTGSLDVFVAKLSTEPATDIRANGSDGPISITESDTLQIRVSLNRFGSDENVDYWLAYRGPSGWIHYNNSTKKWEAGLGVTHQGALMNLNNKKVFQSSGFAPGNYTFYFGVDMNMDGKVTKSSLYKDEVQVTVTSD